MAQLNEAAVGSVRPDVIIIMTDEERAAPSYESGELADWRRRSLAGAAWFDTNATNFKRHYTGSLACVPSRPTILTGHYPDLHGVTQTDGLGKMPDDSRLRWLPEGEVPTLGNWFRAAGYDTHYDGKWHVSHADLINPETGGPLATNDARGVVDQAAVGTYLEANPLEPFGFSGWVGPEPHGAPLANSGFRRDPLIAARVVSWLEDRYARRRAGDRVAAKPFLLVASFVNPHDIVLWPLWARRGLPFEDRSASDEPHGPWSPPIAQAPTADEDLSTKPAAQAAYRDSYPTAYGPAPLIRRAYQKRSQEYRDLYYRLHAEVDGPIDQVRRAVTSGGSQEAVLVRTSDHGDLLGAHGGLHQKWFNLYDEATRVPFSIARMRGGVATAGRVIEDAPTSHVDIVPTLLAAAGIDQAETAAVLKKSFSEVHTLPGRDLMPVVDGVDPADLHRSVYLLTRDNILEGDSGASAAARRLGQTDNPPLPLRIRVPANVGSNFEGIVARIAGPSGPAGSVGLVDSGHPTEPGGQAGHLWKLVRCFDDPATWTKPHVRHLSDTGSKKMAYRTEALDDQWELYDLTMDPIEAVNLWNSPNHSSVFVQLQTLLAAERERSVPVRNAPWPYASRLAVGQSAESEDVEQGRRLDMMKAGGTSYGSLAIIGFGTFVGQAVLRRLLRR